MTVSRTFIAELIPKVLFSKPAARKATDKLNSQMEGPATNLDIIVSLSLTVGVLFISVLGNIYEVMVGESIYCPDEDEDEDDEVPVPASSEIWVLA